MSFFGKLFKAAGKVVGGVARTAASVATHGASDKVLSVLKGLGKAKAAGQPKREQLTTQQQALVNKVAEPLAPRVKQTTLYQSASAGNMQYGRYGSAAPKKRSAYKRRSAAREQYEEAPRAPRSPAKARTAPKGSVPSPRPCEPAPTKCGAWRPPGAGSAARTERAYRSSRGRKGNDQCVVGSSAPWTTPAIPAP